MSSHVWCHGPECHTKSTQDRVRGTKGSKVLRTRKVKQHTNSTWYNPNSWYNWFCSMSCYNDFANKHADAMRRIAPRTEPLETRIEDPEKEEHSHTYSDGSVHKWYSTTIKKIGNESNVG